MNEWARLVDRYAAELKKYELVCSFCGQHLADANVNADCAENTQPRDIADQARNELSNAVVFFTDDEPDHEVFGKRRHWFGRPSQRGYRISTPMSRSGHQGFQNTKGDEVIAKHPELAAVLKRIYDATQQTRSALHAAFNRYDNDNTGHCTKDDFVNTLFEHVKGVKPADLMALVNAFAEDSEEGIGYEDMLAMVEKHGGEFAGHEFKFQQTASEKGTVKGGISQDNRETIFRVKQALSQATGGLVGVEQALRKNGANGGVTINFD